MPTSLAFARFVQLIKVIEQLPIPIELINRHRMQYDYILGRLCIGASKGKHLTVADLSSCAILGSQPTANKRLHELVTYGLISANEGIDRRQKVLTLTPLGVQYLTACSIAMEKAMSSDQITPPAY